MPLIRKVLDFFKRRRIDALKKKYIDLAAVNAMDDRIPEICRRLVVLTGSLSKNATPETNMLHGYYTLLQYPDQEDGWKRGLEFLEKAYAADNFEAAVLLAAAHRGQFGNLPMKLRRAAHAHKIEKKIRNIDHPYSLYQRAWYSMHNHNTEEGLMLANKCKEMHFIGGYYHLGYWASSTNGHTEEKDNEKSVAIWKAGLTDSAIRDIPSLLVKSRILYVLGRALQEGRGSNVKIEEGRALLAEAMKLGYCNVQAGLAEEIASETQSAG